MSKVKLGRIPWVCPIPIVLVGASVCGRANFAEVGDCAVMGIRPALVVVSLGATHHTTRGIEENGAFSINIPTASMLALTDYCGIVSGKDVDKSTLFRVFSGDHTGVPLIDECPIGLECRVAKTFQVEHRRIFIAEVLECYANDDVLDGDPQQPRIQDLEKLDPIIYALNNRYYRVGHVIGTGYQEGARREQA